MGASINHPARILSTVAKQVAADPILFRFGDIPIRNAHELIQAACGRNQMNRANTLSVSAATTAGGSAPATSLSCCRGGFYVRFFARRVR